MRSFILVVVLLVVSVFFFGIRYNTSNNVAEPERVLRVGVECDYPPNNWEDGRSTNFNIPLLNNEGFYADGYDVQIAKLAAKSIGAKLEVKKIAWEDLIPALNNNEIDVIFSGMLDTSARRKLIDFTESYEDRLTIYAICVRRNDKWSNAKTLEDFEGARFIGQVDTNLDTAIDQIPGVIHLPPVESSNQMLDALLNNEADGIISDHIIIQNYIKTHPELKLISLPEGKTFVFDYTGVCAGVRKTDEKLKQELNIIFKNLPSDERQRIMDGAIARHSNE